MSKKLICSILSAAALVCSTNSFAAEELRLGSSDYEIINIQNELYERGYLSHGADGYFGLSTLAAIIKLQEDNDIYVSGTVNDNTREVLYDNDVKDDSIIYNDEDLYWLSRIVYAESRGESYEGKLAVANCVLNRVKSDIYPDTVKEVIFDTNHGVQYQPVANGTIYNTPDSDSINAAKEALDGNNIIGECMFFFNPAISTNSWISENRNYYTTIGNHSFYL